MVVKRANGPTPADEAHDGTPPRAGAADGGRAEGGADGAVTSAVTPDVAGTAKASSADEPTTADISSTSDGPGDRGVPSAPDVPDGQVPIQAQQLIDPRAIARASLEASRNASLWWTSAGVLVATVVAVVVGTRAGAYTLAGVLAVCAVVRAVLPHPGPVAVSVRAKAIDVTVLAVLAVSIGVLAQLLPGSTL